MDWVQQPLWDDDPKVLECGSAETLHIRGKSGKSLCGELVGEVHHYLCGECADKLKEERAMG